MPPSAGGSAVGAMRLGYLGPPGTASIVAVTVSEPGDGEEFSVTWQV